MTKRRMMEIAPGFLSWNLILFLVWGGYFFPVMTAYFILAFDVLWVYKGLVLVISALLSYFQVKAAEHLDWVQEAAGFEDWKKVRHVILIMVANEPFEIYRRTLEKLAKQGLPLEQIVVVMATEGRLPGGREGCEKLRKTLGNKFGEYIVTVHPAGLAGETVGKHSNQTWAAKEAKRILVDEKKWDIRYMTITSNDADIILHQQYFACLTFKFLDDPHRYEKFWQPAVMFYNNIWRLPAPTRVVNTFSNMQQLGMVSRRDRSVIFSNYSASFAMIDKIGYWDVDAIPEDYRIFFKAFFQLGGRVEVEPIFLPSTGDAAESTSTWKTFVNEYKQKQRWAWGVSDIPVFIEMYLRQPNVSFLNKSLRLFRVIEDHVLWPTSWFIVTIGVGVVTFVNPTFSRTTLGFSLPALTSGILSITLVFLIILLVIDAKRRPSRPEGIPAWRGWVIPLEFIFMPLVGFFFGALPGLDAHTRLMLGKYLEYRITEKVK